MQGGIFNGTSATTAFTLPAGFRPATKQVFATSAPDNNNTGIVQIDTTGIVTPTSSATNHGLTFSGLSYTVD